MKRGLKGRRYAPRGPGQGRGGHGHAGRREGHGHGGRGGPPGDQDRYSGRDDRPPPPPRAREDRRPPPRDAFYDQIPPAPPRNPYYEAQALPPAPRFCSSYEPSYGASYEDLQRPPPARVASYYDPAPQAYNDPYYGQVEGLQRALDEERQLRRAAEQALHKSVGLLNNASRGASGPPQYDDGRYGRGSLGALPLGARPVVLGL